MDDHHRAGFVAAIAVTLLAGSWAWLPPSWATGDRDGLDQASRQALEFEGAGQPLLWRGEGGMVAAVTPSRAFRDGDGQWCRSYSVVVETAGRSSAVQNRLGCRDGAGRWSLHAAAGRPLPAPTSVAEVLLAQAD